MEASRSALLQAPPVGARSTGPTPQSGPIKTCQACGVEVAPRPFFRRYRICETHMLADAVMFQGTMQRFCQQCARFHSLTEFDKNHRSCRESSARHAERRRQLRRAHAGGAAKQRTASKRAAQADAPAAEVQHEGSASPAAKRRCSTPQLPPARPAAAAGGSGSNSDTSPVHSMQLRASTVLEPQGSAESAFGFFALPLAGLCSMPPPALTITPAALSLPLQLSPASSAGTAPAAASLGAWQQQQQQTAWAQPKLHLRQPPQPQQHEAAQQLLQLLPATVAALSAVIQCTPCEQPLPLALPHPDSPLPLQHAVFGGSAQRAAVPLQLPQQPRPAQEAVVHQPLSPAMAAALHAALAEQQQQWAEQRALLQQCFAVAAPAAPALPAPAPQHAQHAQQAVRRPSAFKLVSQQPIRPQATVPQQQQALQPIMWQQPGQPPQQQQQPGDADGFAQVQAALKWAQVLLQQAAAACTQMA